MWRSSDQEKSNPVCFDICRLARNWSGFRCDRQADSNVIRMHGFHSSGNAAEPEINSSNQTPLQSGSSGNKANYLAYGSFESDLFYVVEASFGNVVKYMK